MSFSKPQVSFSSNFVSLFSVMKHNSSVLFSLNRYILCTKGTNQSGCLKILSAKIKIHQIVSFLKQQISFSSNFASLFSVMRLLDTFLAEILYTLNKSSLSKCKFGEFSCEQSKLWNFALWCVPFVQII